MGFYDEEKTAREYIAMADGYDGRELIAVLSEHLPKGATVLEIGMGPGTDLDILGQQYRATGSDNSSFFVDLYRQSRPNADVLILDAVTLKTDRTFDCIYSNKVLHHLSEGDLPRSLERQSHRLNDGGYVLHSFWTGSGEEEMHGLKFVYRSEAQIRSGFEKVFDVVSIVTYEELAPDDSIYVLARSKKCTSKDPG